MTRRRFSTYPTFTVIPAEAGIHKTGMKTYYVYILASERNGTLYVGMTSDLTRRMYEHQNGLIDGFTKQYKVHRLVHFEETNDARVATERERQLKKWNRGWKIRLIQENNPDWTDLHPSTPRYSGSPPPRG